MPAFFIIILIVWISLIVFVVFSSIKRVRHINKLTFKQRSEDFNIKTIEIKNLIDQKKSHENFIDIHNVYQMTAPLWKHPNIHEDYYRLYKILMTTKVEIGSKAVDKALRNTYLTPDDLLNYKLFKYSGSSEKRKNSSVQNQMLNN